MGVKNYLIDGRSGTGKTTVAEELQKRDYQVFHGDRELRYRGDPLTGEPLKEPIHDNEYDKALWRQNHQVWDVSIIKSIIEDRSAPITFFCGGSQNSHQFTNLLDGVFILEVHDINIIFERLDQRVARDPTDFGGKPEEKKLVSELHESKQGLPEKGIHIDSTAPLNEVVDKILEMCI